MGVSFGMQPVLRAMFSTPDRSWRSSNLRMAASNGSSASERMPCFRENQGRNHSKTKHVKPAIT